MIAFLLGIVDGGFQLILKVFSCLRGKSDREAGRQSQENLDLKATVKGDIDARRIEEKVHAFSDDELAGNLKRRMLDPDG